MCGLLKSQSPSLPVSAAEHARERGEVEFNDALGCMAGRQAWIFLDRRDALRGEASEARAAGWSERAETIFTSPPEQNLI